MVADAKHVAQIGGELQIGAGRGRARGNGKVEPGYGGVIEQIVGAHELENRVVHRQIDVFETAGILLARAGAVVIIIVALIATLKAGLALRIPSEFSGDVELPDEVPFEAGIDFIILQAVVFSVLVVQFDLPL